eukprot:gnl/TRDRNA2_/TRDRNA2_35051_c0_seq1.p1 gnl/TRDRNA2_/TRDRNA2_35051_c0~~gnl/TRDRNA2_/TRDRNA2_35051_c0_seq1.p1  ORF type:complete len:1165 (+),score=199.27 gnl/TRDRNA2_/TRDRNA2_35051_c0_seq1:67-3495(+)
MPLAGLPAAASGSVVYSSLFSVAATAVGLAILRSTRPSYAESTSSMSEVYASRLTGLFGAMLLWAGLVLGAAPDLIGDVSRQEEKAADLIGCCAVLFCWALERYILRGSEMPVVQSIACVLVWFSTSLIEWARPRPFDNLALGFDTQVAGCDGGYRSPFLVYCGAWITGLVFGTLLLVCGGGERRSQVEMMMGRVAPEDLAEAEQGLKFKFALRAKALPLMFGAANAMAGMTFAVGIASNDMSMILFGAVLLTLAVICAWDWMWRLEMPLGVWAPLAFGANMALTLVQQHLIFRDFRWDEEGEVGLLTMWKWPGLPLFLAGFFILASTLVLFITAGELDRWGLEDLSEYLQPTKEKRQTTLLQYSLFGITCVSFICGVCMPVMTVTLSSPEMIMEGRPADAGEGAKTTGHSYLVLIDFSYRMHLPCSALVLAWNSVIVPPLQGLATLMLLMQPTWLTADVEEALEKNLIDQASFRFTNPFVVMLLVSFLNLTVGHDQNTIFEAQFAVGFIFFLVYCVASVVLAQTLEANSPQRRLYRHRRNRLNSANSVESGMNPFAGSFLGSEALSACATGNAAGFGSCGVPPNDARGMQGGYAKFRDAPNGWDPSFDSHDEMGLDRLDRGIVKVSSQEPPHARTRARLPSGEVVTESEDDDVSSEEEDHVSAIDTSGEGFICLAVLFLVIVAVVIGGFYCGLHWPFLHFQYRVSGVIIQRNSPTVLDLYHSLQRQSGMLGFLAVNTLLIFLVLYSIMVLFRLPFILGCCSDDCKIIPWMNLGERVLRPWVMGHVWAMSVAALYYIVTQRNKDIIEVCLSIPEPPLGLIGILTFGVGVMGILAIVKSFAPSKKGEDESGITPVGMGSLPGGVLVWNVAPAILFGAIWVGLWNMGPKMHHSIDGVPDLNFMLSRAVPAMNRMFDHRFPYSAGDCPALQEYYSSSEDTEAKRLNQNCVGGKPVVSLERKMRTGQKMFVQAKWITGIKTLRMKSMHIDEPTVHEMVGGTQHWNMTIAARYEDLKIWIKVLAGDNAVIDNYMCCDNPFHLTWVISTTCSEEEGFTPLDIELSHVDHVEFVKKVGDPSNTNFVVDYGDATAVIQRALQTLLHNRMQKTKVPDATGGPPVSVSHAVSEEIERLLLMNIGQKCPPIKK